MQVTFREATTPEDHLRIARWYADEWRLPEAGTVESLRTTPNEKVCFQVLIEVDGRPAGTGGLYFQVGLQARVPRYAPIGPWVGLMFTVPELRARGLGRLLLAEVETGAHRRGFHRLFLFTHTAKTLYARSGWVPIEEWDADGKVITVMQKESSAG